MQNWQKYNKAYVALAGFVVAVLSYSLGANDPIVQSVIQLATALGVYIVPNKTLPL